MAVGFGLSIDDSFLKNLKEADEWLDKIHNKSNKLKASTVSAFKEMSEKGVMQYVNSLKKQKQMLDEIANVKNTGGNRLLTNLQSDAKKTIDEINNVIKALERTKNFRNESSGRSALSFANSILGQRGDKSVDNLKLAIRQLEEAQNRQNLNTKRGVTNFNKLGFAITQVKRELDRATTSTDKFKKKHDDFLHATAKLRAQISLIYSASQISSYVNKLVAVRKEFELQQKSLQVLLQSRDEANKLWQQTIDLAVRSPFRVKELVTYTRQLAAYRIETSKLHNTTRMLSDVSAGLGVDMQRLILAFGQVRAANFLRGTELRQFTEAGIPMLDELAKHFTELEGKAISAGDVFEMISKRMVLFEDVEAVFQKMTSEGGAFFKMQEEQSKTLAGMISNLYDSVDLMLNEIGKSYDGFLKGSVNVAKYFVENWEYIAEAIKGVLVALAGHKLYQLAIKQSIIGTALAQGVLNNANAKQLTQIQLLQVGWNKLSASIKTAGASMKSMLAFNLPLLAVTAIIGGVWKLISAWHEHNKEINKISENYDELRKKIEKINVSFNIATDDNDIKTQKQKLNELIVMANNDYNMKIKVDVEGMDAREMQNKFSEISQQMFDANIFSEHFAKQMQKATEWVVEDDIFEDLEQLGIKSNDILHELSLNRERIVFDLQKSQDKLNESQKKALDMLKKPKQIDESEVDYLERLVKGYSLVIEEYSTFKTALKNSKDASTASKLNVEFGKIQETFKRLNIDANSLYEIFTNYGKTIDEAKTEFEEFAKTLDLNGNLTDEQKEIRLKTAIDKLASEKGWNDFVKNYIYRWTEETFSIKFKPVISDVEPLKPWQDTYNRLFRGMEGFREITKNTIKQTKVIDRLNASIKETEDLISRINKAGGIKATGKGGAYEGIDLSQLHNSLIELKKQRDWLGGSDKGKDKDSESKILRNRISLIKELNKEYEKLNQTYDSATSKQKVLDAFGDTFKQAFEGTGISLSSMIVNTDALNNLKDSGEIAGKTLSESMLKEIEQLKEAGTYIRNFDEDFLLKIKERERFMAEAYQDAGGVWTQGYGETINIERGKVWDEEKATMVLRESLTKRYVSQLNEVLDDNKELVLTQKQYNALLDLTYQGGKGAAISILERTKDISKGVDYINLIASKIKETMGDKEAERFGEAFVNKFKEAESVYERIAMLLEISNLTIKGGINKEWYKGMQDRSDKRASAFRGDLETSKVLQKVLVSISDIDFTNIRGVVQQLKQLAPLAKKEGKEAELALSKAISELEVQIDVEAKTKQDKELIDQIEDMFSGYEMSIELQKLNIPPDLAKQLFNVDSVDLSSIRNKISSELAKAQATGGQENRVKELKKQLEKVEELEDKAMQERLKKYTKYLVKAQGERVKIKMDELRQLNEIETLNFTESQKSMARMAVQQESKQKMDKLEWEDFKDSGMYVQLFEDLEYASTSALTKMRERLMMLKDKLSGLDADDLRNLYNQIEKLDEQLAKRSPYKTAITGINEYVKALKESKRLESELDKESSLNRRLKKDESTLSTQLAIEQDEYNQMVKNINVSGKDLNKQYNKVKALESQLALVKAQLIAQGKLTKELEVQLDAAVNTRKTFEGSLSEIGGDISAVANALPQIAGELENVFGAMDEGTRDTINSIATIGSGIGDAIQGFASQNYIQAVSGIAQALGGIFAIGDKKKERQIQREIKLVEDLERAYEKLEKAIDSAYSINTLQASGKAAKHNLEAQIDSYNKMIAAEEDKKKTDHDRIKEWQLAIEDLIEQKAELDKQLVSTATGGIMDDVLSASKDFTDAWLEAFKETGDGLSGLESNFKETMMEMVKQQAAMLISQAYVDRWKKQLEQYINPTDLELSTDEARKWVNAVTTSLPQLNDALEKYFTAMQQAGVDISESGELSGLQRGIQSVSESTAQIIEAYLNSVRFYVADSNSKLTMIANQIIGSDETTNPMLSELRSQTELIRSIRDMFGSVIRNGHPTFGGAFIKVAL